ncbi:dihydrofolate reductase family protein [Actinomadura graeca]|uniref:Dihydrofolate reductase family protein n=1 Tax=Actinomadura graeca TaxID=2750812 RepID=A0ABX8QUY8_9ACTN|nr:dihydrofolate reductase family protein [Actinomadura graeca]QXJ22458.1 dihydrofolate reductase family protein [Actinomadura graeca]
MRIVISEFISLDGVVQAPGGPDEDRDGGFAHGGWTHPYFDPEVVGGAFDAAMKNAAALLYGRRTWQNMAAAWPERGGDPFADKLNALPKYVVSDSLSDDDMKWNTQRIPVGQAAERIAELRGSGDGDMIMMGSPTLARTLIENGLFDELLLISMPVILGGGKSIFPADGVKHGLKLVSTATASTGATVHVYHRADA